MDIKTYPTLTLRSFPSQHKQTTQRRFDPNFARVKRAILEGEVGNVVQVKLCSRDPSPPPFEYVKGGGGIFKVCQRADSCRVGLWLCLPIGIHSTIPRSHPQ